MLSLNVYETLHFMAFKILISFLRYQCVFKYIFLNCANIIDAKNKTFPIGQKSGFTDLFIHLSFCITL